MAPMKHAPTVVLPRRSRVKAFKPCVKPCICLLVLVICFLGSLAVLLGVTVSRLHRLVRLERVRLSDPHDATSPRVTADVCTPESLSGASHAPA